MAAFTPSPVRTLKDTGLDQTLVENLLLRALYDADGMTGTQLAKRTGLPLQPVLATLADLKKRQWVVHRRAGLVAGDYDFDLSDEGVHRATRSKNRVAWSHTAPVPWNDWLASVAAQSVRGRTIQKADLLQAMFDLELSKSLLRRLGMALSAGRALLLYGPPGNGKTSIAERVTRAHGGHVYLPRVILVDGHWVRLFDPKVHRSTPDEQPDDGRWVRCERPTVLVGGELKMTSLEMHHNPDTHVCEAPIQMKAACGTLVIDDLGRQQMQPAELLNRWILPLDRAKDILTLPDGKTIDVPFDPFVVFSTNLDPEDLADEAFLRRIPYKLRIQDPTPDVYLNLLTQEARSMGIQVPEESVKLLLSFYDRFEIDLRACHPRDLLAQATARQKYLKHDVVLTERALKDVLRNYFVQVASL